MTTKPPRLRHAAPTEADSLLPSRRLAMAMGSSGRHTAPSIPSSRACFPAIYRGRLCRRQRPAMEKGKMSDKAAPGAPPPWTVKNVPLAERAKIVSAAQAASETVWEWLSPAVNAKLSTDLPPRPAVSPARALDVVTVLAAALPALAKSPKRIRKLTGKVLEQHLEILLRDAEDQLAKRRQAPPASIQGVPPSTSSPQLVTPPTDGTATSA